MLWFPGQSIEDGSHSVLSSLFQGLGTAAVTMGSTLAAAHRLCKAWVFILDSLRAEELRFKGDHLHAALQERYKQGGHPFLF